MPASRRSRTGCNPCRQRKLKCDEVKPICGLCKKARRACIPTETSIFRLHQLSRPADAGTTNRPTLVSGPEADPVARPAFREITFIQVAQPSRGDVDEQSASASPSLIRDDDDNQDHAEAAPESRPSESDSPSLLVCDRDLHMISGHHMSFALSGESQPNSPGSQGQPAEGLTATSVQLLHYFKEIPGKWMDLFDVTAYFTFSVPRLAATRPLLLNSSCALASKHIDRILQSMASRPGVTFAHFKSEYWNANLWTRNWRYESVAYYNEAIRLLMHSIGSLEATTRSTEAQHSGSEEMLAAIAILCVYELLDPPGPEWEAHLSALPLLETAPTQILSSESPSIMTTKLFKRSIFWNFVRQDSLYAFINETHTRLNMENLGLWRQTGLLISDDGLLLPSHPSTASESPHVDMDEDLVSHGLFWLLGKIVNFIAAPEELQSETASRWNRLEFELRNWHNSLPVAFSSYVRAPLLETQVSNSMESLTSYDRILYAIPTCASTIQNYHMACILLLMNKPQQTTTLRTSITERVQAYRVIQEQVAYHSREICGISLGNPPESVRVQSVQPLFVAGQCMSGIQEREMVLNLLRGIENDLGWATTYRAQKLIQEWNASSTGEKSTDEVVAMP